MGIYRYKRIILSLVAVGGVSAVVLLFLMLGPPGLLAKSSKPDFCAQCHVMEAQYEAWVHVGAHRRKLCVDCHLPNDNRAVHYIWKGLTGLKDAVFFYSGRVPERIMLTAHGEAVLQANCIRCHETTVSLMDTERKCWSCHRRISHQLSGTIATI
jgi:cytochrome c nitrite reductase small subunit